MEIQLMASMMCANYGNLEKEVKELEEGGIDSFHIDIMDGRYVPNFAMSLNDMRFIAGAAKKPLDVHLDPWPGLRFTCKHCLCETLGYLFLKFGV